jgi:hypothetical protein
MTASSDISFQKIACCEVIHTVETCCARTPAFDSARIAVLGLLIQVIDL